MSVTIINSRYKVLVDVKTGDFLRVKFPDYNLLERVTEIDETHFKFGNKVYHIHQFGLLLDKSNATVDTELEDKSIIRRLLSAISQAQRSLRKDIFTENEKAEIREILSDNFVLADMLGIPFHIQNEALRMGVDNADIFDSEVIKDYLG